MSSTETLTNIRASARLRADQVNSDFRSDAQVDKLINQTWKEVYEHVVMNQPERYLGSTTITTVTGTDTYAIPASDFFKAKSVDVDINGRSRTVSMFKWEDRNRYQDGRGWDFDSPVAWRLYGNNIVFLPRPSGVYSVTLWYHPAPPLMTSGSDTIDGVAGWEEAVIVGTAWKLALEEADLELADRLGAEYQRQLARILDFGAVRVTEETEFARDVYKSAYDEDFCR